jgi:diguanylate cyclase (GGDEF)-like protein/PAS domain S-box-containing protein
MDKRNHALLFFGIFFIVTGIFYTLGNVIIPNAISAGIIAVFSILSAISIRKNNTEKKKLFSNFMATTFGLHAVFFLVFGLSWLIGPTPEFTSAPTTIEILSYIIIFISADLWTFSFIFLMNQRLMKETVESKEKYTLMFSTIPDAVLISRLSDGLILEVNQGFVKLSGYSREEAEGKTTADLNIWFDPTERARYVVILTEMKAIEDMEFQFRRKNGRLLLGLLSSKLIDVDGEKHVLNVVRDITSRKKMEDKLRENEQKYRFLTENSGDVIWHINKSYRIDYISSADERIRGYRREEVIGTQIWSVFKPEGIELVRKKIAHHLEMGQIGNNNQITRFEIEQRCKDGSWIWTEIVAAPHYDKYGNLIGYHGLSRDITERKQLLDQLYHEATVDELTQVPNRRHFMNLAEIEFRRAKRYHHPLSLVVIDFDDLKHVNDTYGHLAGDRALSVFSKVVNEIIRDVDVLGRFGGDEFLLLLPETDAEHALLVMERIRNILTSSPVFFGEKSFTISFSAGIASLKEWTDTIEELLNRADSALYQTKDKGGDGASTNW